MSARFSMKSKYKITILLTCRGCPRIPYISPDKKSAESNTSIYPRFGLIINTIQWFLQKYHIWFLSQIFEGKCILYQIIKTTLTESYMVPIRHPCLATVETDATNYINDFSMFLLPHFINFLARFTVFEIIVVVVPQHWAVMALLSDS